MLSTNLLDLKDFLDEKLEKYQNSKMKFHISTFLGSLTLVTLNFKTNIINIHYYFSVLATVKAIFINYIP